MAMAGHFYRFSWMLRPAYVLQLTKEGASNKDQGPRTWSGDFDYDSCSSSFHIVRMYSCTSYNLGCTDRASVLIAITCIARAQAQARATSPSQATAASAGHLIWLCSSLFSHFSLKHHAHQTRFVTLCKPTDWDWDWPTKVTVRLCHLNSSISFEYEQSFAVNKLAL